MLKRESIYEVSYKLTPKATILRTDYVKAYDHDHAKRIAQRLFINPHPRGEVVKVTEVSVPAEVVSPYERKRLEERRSP